MAVDALLSRLENVKKTGAGRWIARCPAHTDRRASLSIRELDDGRILVHCFAGCSIQQVLTAADLEFDCLFPEQRIQHGKPERRPFPAADVLRAVAFEALAVSIIALDLANASPLSDTRRERLLLAASRLQVAAGAFDD